jgi:parallel beta-helix repeat protein
MFASFSVTNTNDSGAGSLRQAIHDTNVAGGTNTITFSVNGTITLSTALEEIANNVTITGPGPKSLTIARSSAGGTPQFSVFRVGAGQTVTISGLTITNGDSADGGGGIRNKGTLTLNNCNVTGNKANENGGGIFTGYNSNSTVDATLTANNCTISNNHTTSGTGDGLLVQSFQNSAFATLTNCTITGNTATGSGLSQPTSASLYLTESLKAHAELNLFNCTVADNQFGVLARYQFFGQQGELASLKLVYKNSIFAEGVYTKSKSQFVDPGVSISQGHNLVKFAYPSDHANFGGSDLQDVDPKLAAFGDYSGPVSTYGLRPDSPAIDGGDNNNAPATDARGLNRIADGNADNNAVIDIGAFEKQKYLVTNTNDSGSGSLRQAITDNNAAGGGLIAFNISGSGVKTIIPGSLGALPNNTAIVDINGYTQPGATPNTLAVGNNANLLIELSGQGTGGGTYGLTLANMYSSIRGLVINRFGNSGIRIGTNADNSVVQGNFIGTNAAGTTALGNARGIFVDIDATNSLIGTNGDGTNDDAERNVISGNSSDGIQVLAGASGTVIAGNYIGTNAAGTTALGNSVGVYLFPQAAHCRIGTDANGSGDTAERNIIAGNRDRGVRIEGDGATNNLVAGNYIGVDVTGLTRLTNDQVNISITNGAANNRVGGTTAASRNVVSAGLAFGILIEGNGTEENVVSGNYIGLAADGATAVGGSNGPANSYGIRIRDASNNTVGGTVTGSGNLIAKVGGIGVAITGNATGNRILGNLIHGNSKLGIDLNEDGVTANDGGNPPDSDPGPNHSQNFPVISSATIIGSTVTTSGTLSSTPNTSFTVEVFLNSTCDASGNGQGKVLLGSQVVTSDSSGLANFSLSASDGSAAIGLVVTATATNNVNGDTSEFSACKAIIASTPGSLQFGSAAFSVAESASSATITVLRTGGTSGTVSVNYTTANGTATGGAGCTGGGVDYISQAGTLSWADGETGSKSFTITPCDDTQAESSETLALTLSNPTNGATLGSQSSATLTITDNDTATITVTNLNDSGAGSLRQAITDANVNSNADVIGFSAALQGTISLASALPTLSTNIVINGPGARIINVTRNSGNPFRIFYVPTGTQSVTISGLTISNGRLLGNAGTTRGGGILNEATLVINDCTIRDNVVTDFGDGGGVANKGTLTINRSTLTNNTAGTKNFSNKGGGGLANLSGGTATLNNCTLSGNTATRGGAIVNATDHNADHTVTVVNLNNCTVAYNTGLETFFAAGAFDVGYTAEAKISIGNSIVAFNSPNSFGINSGTYDFNAPNLSDNYSGVPNGALHGFAIAATPLLGQLSNNGGQTDTLALLPDSPGIDSGSNTNAPSSDQRGFTRIVDGNNDGNAKIDIGAYEGGLPFVVTTNADSGPGSLRQAILDNNTSYGGGVIVFNIPGNGVQTISLLSPLPTITRTVRIDGYSQPGTSKNTSATAMNAVVLIELNGTSAGATTDGLFISAPNVRVRGLSINRFGGSGVRVNDSTTGVSIDGNFIGTDPTGLITRGNKRGGVLVQTGSSFNNIGGNNVDLHNLISGNQNAAVRITGNTSNNNRVQGNLIGVAADGTTAMGNTSGSIANGGVLIAGASNQVGGSNGNEGNVIRNNAGPGISISGGNTNNNIVRSNVVSSNTGAGITLADGSTNSITFNTVSSNSGGGVVITNLTTTTLSSNTITDNSGNGISLSSSQTTTIGSNTVTGNTGNGIDIAGATGSQISSNTIANNGSRGINVTATASGNSFLNNLIYDNANLGIDLNADGVTPNDPNYAWDIDSGSNGLQNYPVILSASYGGANTRLVGTLASKPSTSYTLEFYTNTSCDSSGYGEGKTRINATTASTNENGAYNFDLNVASNLTAQFITATATNTVTKETSEFSQCRLVENQNSIGFTASTYKVGENSFNATIRVQRFGPSSSAASVQISTVAGGSATSGGNCSGNTDYVPKTQTLTWGANDSSIKDFQFLVCSDTTAEGPNETVNLELSNPSGATLASQTTAVLTILDDEFLVTNLNDSGPGSLREAITAGNANRDSNDYPYLSEIRFADGLTGTINLNSALPTLNGGFYIYGPGADVLTVRGAPFTQGVFNNSFSATISDLSITGGNGSNCVTDGCGAGVYNDDDLVLARVRIFGNSARSAEAGGVFHRNGALTVIDSTIDNNTVRGGGAGVTLVSDGGGATSAFFDNVTISNNVQTAFSDETPRGAGAVYARSVSGSGLSVGFINCTIAGNTGFNPAQLNNPGAVLVTGTGNLGISFYRTLVANNSGPQFRNETSAVFNSQGFNLDADGSSGFVNGTDGNIVGSPNSLIDPMLSPLTMNNGGRTPTQALMVGSPAIDAGGTNVYLPADQRGQSSPVDGNGDGVSAYDIGAFELQRYVVTSYADSGPNTLRQAILDNNAFGAALIAFKLPQLPPPTRPGTFILKPTSALPSITRPVQIDGTSQGIIQLSGESAEPNANGFTIQANDSLIQGFVLRNFGGNAVAVVSGTGNRILSNLISNNGLLAIDLGNDGPTANDQDDADTGANNLQNFPLINTANDGLRMIGTFNSLPNTPYLFQFFSRSTCQSTGNDSQSLLGEASFTTDANGNLAFDQSFVRRGMQNVTATATNKVTGDTSEFSPCKPVEPANHFVFSKATSSKSESEGNASFTIQRTGVASDLGAATVQVNTLNGTAIGGASCTSGVDYISSTQTISWALGDNSDKTFSITICSDGLAEADETFSLTLSNPTGGAAVGALGTTVHTITNSDLLVSNNNDSGAGSLRAAIETANATPTSDYISFASNVTGSIDLLTQLPPLSDLTINGPGANVLSVRRSNATGTPDFRIFTIPNGNTVTIRGLTVTNGAANLAGGILNEGNLTLNNVAVTGNTGNGDPNEIKAGGIYNRNILTASNITISGNQTLLSAGDAGGLMNYNEAGPVTATLTNCTISGNSSTDGIVGSGGIFSAQTSEYPVLLTLNSCTVVNNSNGNGPSQAGGLLVFGNTVKLFNTIVAGNTARDFRNINGGTFTTLGNNIDRDGTSGFTNGVNGDIVGSSGSPINVQLGTLANNGGQTQTHALLSGSPAIDHGNNTGAPATDQRGFNRTIDGDANGSAITDIGAFEKNAPNQAPINSVPAAQTTNENTALVFNEANNNVIAVSDPDSGANPVQVAVTITNGTFSANASANAIVNGNNSAQVTIKGTVSVVNAALNGASYTPALNYTGTASLSITVNDLGNSGEGGPLSDTDSVSINVIHVNGAPVAANDSYSTQQNVTLNVPAPGVLANDNDSDSATITAALVTNATHGSLTFNNNGSFSYTPQSGFTGSDSFTYQASDGSALSNTATVNITVDPIQSTGEFSFSQSNFNVNEDGGTATITVLRSNGATGAASVSYRTDVFAGTNAATEGGDYNATSGTLDFADGEVTKTFTVAIHNDTLNEGDELVSLVLSAPTSGTTLGTQSTATLTIVDDDGVPSVQFSEPSYTVNEGATTATITVNRVSGGSNAFSVNYSTSDLPDGATAGDDYQSINAANLNFAAGEDSKTFTVAILDDTLFEANEALSLQLSNPIGATLAAQHTATLTINDNDSQPRLQFSSATYREDENSTTATITVTRSGGTNSGISVQYATSNGTATAADYTATSGTLHFGAGQTEQTFTVTLAEDSLFEGDETIGLTLSNAVGAVLGTPGTAELTITDNDGPPVVQFSSVAYSVTEGTAEAIITVNRTGGSNGGVTVAYNTTTGAATPGADFTATSGVLTFEAGETSRTFTIPITDDFEVEGAETINLELTNAGGGATLGTLTTAVLTINDNDTPPCASDVTSQLSIVRGGLTQNLITKRFRQTVTIKNNSGVAITGPIAFVVDALSSNATMFGPNGTTSCATPLNSPFANVNVGNDNILSNGETVTVVLEFTNSTPQQSITYNPRVLAGSGVR